jgi:hypothetical protein
LQYTNFPKQTSENSEDSEYNDDSNDSDDSTATTTLGLTQTHVHTTKTQLAITTGQDRQL